MYWQASSACTVAVGYGEEGRYVSANESGVGLSQGVGVEVGVGCGVMDGGGVTGTVGQMVLVGNGGTGVLRGGEWQRAGREGERECNDEQGFFHRGHVGSLYTTRAAQTSEVYKTSEVFRAIAHSVRLEQPANAASNALGPLRLMAAAWTNTQLARGSAI